MAALLEAAKASGRTLVRLPAGQSSESLGPHIDIVQSLSAQRLVRSPGFLAQHRESILVVPMAERLTTDIAHALARAQDEHEMALVLLDEGLDDEAGPWGGLLDRIAFGLSVLDEPFAHEEPLDCPPMLQRRFGDSAAPDALIERACQALLAMGIGSFRKLSYTLRLTMERARIRNCETPQEPDLLWALAYTALPFATQPAPEHAAAEQEAGAHDPSHREDRGSEESTQSQPPDTEEDSPPSQQQGEQAMSIETLLAQLPPGLLKARLVASRARGPASRREGGRASHVTSGLQGSGVRVGSVRRMPRGQGEQFALLPTIRAALPLQRLRGRTLQGDLHEEHAPRIRLLPEDVHIWRVHHRRPSTTLFLVDASGSMAMSRLGEAKGAVELLLAECYVRRDRVALISFGGWGARMLLPPTRSLTAARRALSALPGGGGSPLSAGLMLSLDLLRSLQRAGEDLTLVVLSDCRANLRRNGSAGRTEAFEEARRLARMIGPLARHSVVIDPSLRPEPSAEAFARSLSARYVPMPFGRAQQIHQAIKSSTM